MRPKTAKPRALVTGANGFIGSALVSRLLRDGWRVRAGVRTASVARVLPPNAESIVIGEVGAGTDWNHALAGVDVVLHLAARAHVLRETSVDPLAEFRRVNTAGTEHLARMAVGHGVHRMVLLSSIGVNGQYNSGRPFTEADRPAPVADYAISKFEAERALTTVAAATPLETVIVRSPLVYGPGVKGNFARLLWLVNSGIPIPLGRVRNLRSLIHLDNLVELLRRCATHPAASGELFLAADGEDLSTPELIRRLAQGLGRPARLLPVPTSLLYATGRMLGLNQHVEQLCGCLRVDNSRACQLLGWAPVVTVEEGLGRTAAWYLTSGRI